MLLETQLPEHKGHPSLYATVPVRYIAKDDPSERPANTIGLCLSGGGYRAMLYHLGALWRLNELGLLRQLDRISSVSGGSIIAGYLACCWSKLSFDEAGVAKNFSTVFVPGIRELAGVTVDIKSGLSGLLIPTWIGTRVAHYYDKILFHGATLQDLPNPEEAGNPRFVINATSLQTGDLWRFSRPYMGDWRVGLYDGPDIPLATAVAASSAFPPVLSPVTFKLNPSRFRTDIPGVSLPSEKYRSKVVLADGGVYDNLGLETVWKRCRTVLVSDGGAPVDPQQRPWALRLSQMKRISVIMDQQIVDLRVRQLVESYKRGRNGVDGNGDGQDDVLARNGAYWGILSELDSFPIDDPVAFPPADANAAADTPTRLKALPDDKQERLINWGYAVCDAAVRSYYLEGSAVSKAPVLPYSA